MGGGQPVQGIDYEKFFNQTSDQLNQLLKQAPLKQPDLADPVEQAARASQMLNQQLKRGRASTFLPDPPAAIGTKNFLGG